MNNSQKKRTARAVRFVDADTARDAVEHLQIARNLLAGMGARKAADKVRHALKSAEGAQRHVDGLHGRVFPPDHTFWRGYRTRVSVLERLHPALKSESGDLEFYIRAAEQHGKDDDPDHEVGDLQDHLRDVWTLLTSEQRAAFAALSDVRERVELGIGDDDDEDEGAERETQS
jgi:hypothetical protein